MQNETKVGPGELQFAALLSSLHEIEVKILDAEMAIEKARSKARIVAETISVHPLCSPVYAELIRKRFGV